MIDLHTHSTYSDGTLTPAQLIALAQELHLEAIALCDHNTVAGLPEFLAAAEGSGVDAIPGIEFSTDYGETELHILALFVEPAHYAAVTAKVEEMLVRKEASNLALIGSLDRAGISLDYAAIKASTPNGQVNRAVIAAEMVRKGYCASVKEAFRLWLAPERGHFQPPKRLDACETIRFIRSIEAVSVLAHPFLNLEEKSLREFLAQAVGCGLDGMETEYSTFSQQQRTLARQIAAEFGLLMSGGSDFHGENKPDIQLGTGRGDLRVPKELLEQLRSRKAEKSVDFSG